ncbi:MAG TPA: hypothetical protein V6D23_02880, partial [Candidatus Obscuribacterales bacterium]
MSTHFLIFSLARSGSTTLSNLLNECVQAQLTVNEPFHPQLLTKFGLTCPASPAELAAAVEDLTRRHRGIKHVWHPAGWPFPVASLNYDLLLSPGLDVILLVRANILQRVVSMQICDQLQIWQPMNQAQRLQYTSFDFQELDETVIDSCLRHERSQLQECRNLLRRAHKRWLEVSYEELYSPDRDRR